MYRKYSCPETYLKLSQSSPQDIMAGGNIEQITRKTRIYPNPEQKKLFDKCFNQHNYFYNKAVEALRENSKHNLKSLRKLFIPRKKQMRLEDMWMNDVPLDTREYAAVKALHAQKTGFGQIKAGCVKQFKLSFRSKKYSTPVFYVAKKALIDGSIFGKRLGDDHKNLVSKRDKKVIKRSDGIFSITKDNDGRYYINIVIQKTERKKPQKSNIVALDPGVRTFQTMYSQKSTGEFGYDTSKRLYELYRRENRLKSIIATKKLTREKRYKLKKRCSLLRTKVKNIVSDLHWKTADFLTKHFQVILLPIFSSKQMSNRKSRKIGKTTTRLLQGLSHYSFQQKLLYKGAVRGRNVILCKEHYTTKCCGRCGVMNNSIGSKKIFQCGSCGLVMDRDAHASRNILIRAASTYVDVALGCGTTR